jgi:hypothetical protein
VASDLVRVHSVRGLTKKGYIGCHPFKELQTRRRVQNLHVGEQIGEHLTEEEEEEAEEEKGDALASNHNTASVSEQSALVKKAYLFVKII